MKLILFACLLGLSTTVAAQTINGRATSIEEGDTFTLRTADSAVNIRLYGVDCPEKGQPFGNVARAFTSQLLEGKDIRVVGTEWDRFGRLQGLVIAGPDTLNIALLRAGLAWHYKKQDKSMYWAILEQEARRNKTGLWVSNSPIAPWEWAKKR